MKAKTDTTVTLKWSRSKGADGYLVYRYDSAQKKYVKIAAVKARSYKATGLKADTTYKFAVRSYVREDGITLIPSAASRPHKRYRFQDSSRDPSGSRLLVCLVSF